MPPTGPGWRRAASTSTASASIDSTSTTSTTRLGRTMPVLLAVLTVLAWLPVAHAMPARRIAELRRETVAMFYHGYDNYMRIAFPEDELRPVSCKPLTRTSKGTDVALDDVLGNYSLTLIDTLSTLAVLASAPAEDGDVGPRALRDFQDGIAALVAQYGDGSPGPAGQGLRGRGFDMDSKVQVFETVIRGVGGLLSAHLFAIGALPIRGYAPPPAPSVPEDVQTPIAWPNGFVYDGQLLRLALDLATRLLPAFYTPTGMPYPRVNLRWGIPFYTNSPLFHGGTLVPNPHRAEGRGPAEITETCTAGAGSLVLEFSTLSRLTGDQRFEQLAKRAFWAVWYRRSDIGLLGAGIDAETGRWIGGYSVIGAGADSFFEYALKTYILLAGHGIPNVTLPAGPVPAHHDLNHSTRAAPNAKQVPLRRHDPNAIFHPLSEAENTPEEFLEVWHLAHAAVKRHLYSERGHPHYNNVNVWTGSLAAQWVDSLSAYYPGLLAMAGEVEEAVATNLLHTAIWAKFGALPERFSTTTTQIEGGLGWWPLRPEFVESVYQLFQATKDPWYLSVGEMVQSDIQRRCRTSCGWAGLQDVGTGQLADRMESFFLGETTKYMYLLYDEAHPLNTMDAAYVFTTEAHPLILPKARAGGEKDSASTLRKKRTTSGKNKGKSDKPPSGLPNLPTKGAITGDVAVYNNSRFTHTCPAPAPLMPLTGSNVAARGDLFHAPKMVGLTPRTTTGRAETPFVWTVPASMLPADGVSRRVQQPLELSLEFTAESTSAATAAAALNALVRIAPDKIRINSISGLKFLFRMEDDGIEHYWRVVRVSGVPLGRDESVVIDRALIDHITDPRFMLVRDASVVKVHHLHYAAWMEPDGAANESAAGSANQVAVILRRDDDTIQVGLDTTADDGDGAKGAHNHHHIPPERLMRGAGASVADRLSAAPTQSSLLASLVKSMWRQIASTLDLPARATAAPDADAGGEARTRTTRSPIFNVVLNATGVTPTGPGSAPLPDADVASGVQFPEAGHVPATMLPWTSVYAGGYACNAGADGQPGGPLPEAAVLAHQVLVLRRGRCSFSEKLGNIPMFAPAADRLQLVVVVSDDGDVRAAHDAGTGAGAGAGAGPMTFHDDPADFVRPLLEEAQFTPGGFARRAPVPMVMVGGGDEAYAQLSEARQLGLTRRYVVESQGVRVRNLVVDDSDGL